MAIDIDPDLKDHIIEQHLRYGRTLISLSARLPFPQANSMWYSLAGSVTEPVHKKTSRSHALLQHSRCSRSLSVF